MGARRRRDREALPVSRKRTTKHGTADGGRDAGRKVRRPAERRTEQSKDALLTRQELLHEREVPFDDLQTDGRWRLGRAHLYRFRRQREAPGIDGKAVREQLAAEVVKLLKAAAGRAACRHGQVWAAA